MMRQLADVSPLLHRLVKPVSLVCLLLQEQKHRGVRKAIQKIREFLRLVFKPAAVLHDHETML